MSKITYEKGLLVKNKKGVEAEVLSSTVKEIENRKETWYSLFLVEKKKIIEVKKIEITKGSWSERKKRLTAEQKEKKTEEKKEKNRNINLHIKKIQTQGNIISLDQSTVGTGYSIVKLNGTQEIVKYGIITPNDDCFIKRTLETLEKIKELILNYNVVAIAMENIYLDIGGFRQQLSSKASSFEKLAYLKNRIVEMTIVDNLPVTLIPASEWKAYFSITKAGDREKQKAKSKAIIKTIINEELKDDITDSLLIAKYVLDKRIKVCECDTICNTCDCK